MTSSLRRCSASLSARRSRRWCKNNSSRSEEHTSELQSQSNLVCRLLLEKKNPLIRPHLSYLAAFRATRQAAHIRAIAHLTGANCEAHLPRPLPAGLEDVVHRAHWRDASP